MMFRVETPTFVSPPHISSLSWRSAFTISSLISVLKCPTVTHLKYICRIKLIYNSWPTYQKYASFMTFSVLVNNKHHYILSYLCQKYWVNLNIFLLIGTFLVSINLTSKVNCRCVSLTTSHWHYLSLKLSFRLLQWLTLLLNYLYSLSTLSH